MIYNKIRIKKNDKNRSKELLRIASPYFAYFAYFGSPATYFAILGIYKTINQLLINIEVSEVSEATTLVGVCKTNFFFDVQNPARK